jgi:oxygen-independent coproporphyrinogen-3 oxidase
MQQIALIEAALFMNIHQGFGFYFHIPFCSSICTYCDFEKTAASNKELMRRYFANLQRHLEWWLDFYGQHRLPPVSSLFFGGGTPSLFCEEYEPIFASLRPFLAAECEISLEANVDSLSADALKKWRELGFNRISIGVQSFNDQNLEFLTRRHTARQAWEKLELTRQFFENINIDLIFGIPGQAASSFMSELDLSQKFDLKHLSLYSLTYEPATLLGKKQQRGQLISMAESDEEQLFLAAADKLQELGYHHEEISNWSLPGYSCRHNWLYWRGGSYVGIGASAHSHLAEAEGIGLRFSYPYKVKEFCELAVQAPAPRQQTLQEQVVGCGAVIDERDLHAFILEAVWCGLRTDCGVDLAAIEARTGRRFEASVTVRRGLDEGILLLDPSDKVLKLSPSHWFRESAWTLQVALSFV